MVIAVPVDVSHDSCYHRTDVDTQLSKTRAAWRPLLAKLIGDLCLLSPGARLSAGLRRTGRTTRWSRPGIRRDLLSMGHI